MMFLWLWGILIAALLAPGVNRFLGGRGGFALAIVPATIFGRLVTHWQQVVSGEAVTAAVDWVPALNLAVSLRLDGLSLTFGLLITGIGALVLVYAGGYLKGDSRLGRLWMLLLLFMGAMLGLVLANNLLTLFIFWELTSIISYLLIGFNSDRAESRASALQALLVTGAGGLALLPGLLLLGIAGGSFEISTLATNAEDVRQHAFYLPVLVLILCGAFTKSAQFPFHFWLPNAMAAPTPISAYLHSATMVKAGVYLIARMHPVLGGTAAWFWVIASVGAITMLVGAVLALRATDLKQILAYATISVLGTLTMLLGLGTEATLTAALMLLIAHAFYKASLFMVAGTIDHAVHDRDIRNLGGLWSAMPMTFLAAGLAGLSMAGVLPTFGFIAKETWYEALGEGSGIPFLVVSVASNMFLVAAVGLVCFLPFRGKRTATTEQAHEGYITTWSPPLIMGLAAITLGLKPEWLSGVISAGSSAIAGHETPVKLALWHGVNATLILSLLTLAGGVMLYWQRSIFAGVLQGLHRFDQFGPTQIYRYALSTVIKLAARITALLQNGYLRFYLLTMVGIMVVSVWMALGTELRSHMQPTSLDLELHIHEALLAGLTLVAAAVAVRARTWLLAVGALGVVGYCVAGIFVLFGAPDLAMTQFVVETLTVILFVLAFARLPDFRRLSSNRTRLHDALVAIVAGATITTLLLFAITVRSDHPVSDFYAAHSVTDAHGRNIVNVILVDFRALDTLGEITVLSIAAIGVYSLLKLRVEREDQSKPLIAAGMEESTVGNADATTHVAGKKTAEPGSTSESEETR